MECQLREREGGGGEREGGRRENWPHSRGRDGGEPGANPELVVEWIYPKLLELEQSAGLSSTRWSLQGAVDSDWLILDRVQPRSGPDQVHRAPIWSRIRVCVYVCMGRC